MLPAELWITSSDDFASWGGGDLSYRTPDLVALIKAVDYVSMHTYPYHNTHYNPEFWRVPAEEESYSDKQKIDSAMARSVGFAKAQFNTVKEYVRSVDPSKFVHIGETCWASILDGHYFAGGSRATDEYKQGLYYQQMRRWTNANGISCFYFEAFNEQWKDAGNPNGSENHFGLFDHKGEAKYALWDLVDQGIFQGLTRDGNPIIKTYEGDVKALMQEVMTPPAKQESAVQH